MSKNKKKRRNRTIQNTQKINRNLTERNIECDSGKKSLFFEKFKNSWRHLPKKILNMIMNIFSYSFSDCCFLHMEKLVGIIVQIMIC